MTAFTPRLPMLRQELRLEPGTPLPSGAPGWVLFDPLRHLFFQLGQLEQRVVAHWSLGDAGHVRDTLIAEGVHAEDATHAITAFHEFAIGNGLVRDAGVAALAARHEHARRDWWQWLLDHYLFVRIPLVRPAAFLSRTLPVARQIWSSKGIVTLVTMALIGLFLVSRQWDAFTASFTNLMTPDGIAAWGAALLFVKFFHELGHAYTATRFGVRVPTMGVSFLVMVPVLYTDTSAAWRLRSKLQRVRIDAAGLMAEFSVAAVALFAWSFLPDGAIRTSAFVLATTSLATSLLVNASPFMRFDGYYILSDLLGVPNLAPRSFALARWKLRELLFDLREAPAEDLPAGLRRAMLAYAVVTIAYRAALYVGIALLVYHAFFKALGVALFMVEVYVFLARPIVTEFKEWRARKHVLTSARRPKWTGAILAAMALAAFLPLDRSVSMPALLVPLADKPVVTGDPAIIERIFVQNGQTVTAGQPLIQLSSPTLTLDIAQSQLRIAQLERRLARGVADAIDLADDSVLRRDLAAERDRLSGLERRRNGLVARAATDGRVTDLANETRPGVWTDGRQPLLRVVSPDRYDAQAYLPEEDAWRIAPGTTGRFVPDEAAASSWWVRLSEVGATGVTAIPALLSVAAGGSIAVADQKDLKPKQALIAVHLIAERHAVDSYIRPVRGRVVIGAKGESLAAKIVRQIGRVWSREISLN